MGEGGAYHGVCSGFIPGVVGASGEASKPLGGASQSSQHDNNKSNTHCFESSESQVLDLRIRWGLGTGDSMGDGDGEGGGNRGFTRCRSQ